MLGLENRIRSHCDTFLEESGNCVRPSDGYHRRMKTRSLAPGWRVVAPLMLAPLLGKAWAQSGPAAPMVVQRTTTLEVGEQAVTGPKWSPDGTWIAYSLPKGNGIGLIRPDGSLRRILTQEGGSGYRFAWSPDGSRLAFRTAVKEKGARQYSVKVIGAQSGEIEESSGVFADLQPPLWQQGPHGMRWISHAAGVGEICGKWDVGRPATAVFPPLLVVRSRGIWLFDSDPEKQRKLSGEFGLNPSWNRQGTAFAFDALDVVAVASPEAEENPRLLFAGQHPCWSPDAKWLAYQITRDHSHAVGDTRQHTADTMPHLHDDKTNHRIVDSDIWLAAPDGSSRFQLTNTPDLLEEDPDWSPDGACIVCRDENSGRLFVLHLSTP